MCAIMLQFTQDPSLAVLALDKGLLPFIFSLLSFDKNPVNQCYTTRQLKGLQLEALTLLNNTTNARSDMESHISTAKHLMSFLSRAIECEGPNWDRDKNNSTSEVVGLVAAVLHCILVVSEVDLQVKLVLGELDAFQYIFGIFCLI